MGENMHTDLRTGCADHPFGKAGVYEKKIADRRPVADGAAAASAPFLRAARIGRREGYVNNKLNIVTEPGESSDYVSFYKDGKKAAPGDMTWTDNGRHGKALVLDGVSEYLQIPETQMKLAAFSFTAWINWQGAKDTAGRDRVFTGSGFHCGQGDHELADPVAAYAGCLQNGRYGPDPRRGLSGV